MRLPHDFDEGTWRRMIERLDVQVGIGIETYIRARSLGAGELEAGFSELALLRAAAEPDYSAKGVPAAYAFRYLPKRVASVLAALTRLPGTELPRRVLDIGAGSGAAAIALSLLDPAETVRIDAIEPSETMRSFAGQLELSPAISLWQTGASIEDLAIGRISVSADGYDLVTMSACLPYGLESVRRLLSWVRRAVSSSTALIVIEPQAKAEQLRTLRRGLEGSRRGCITEYCCHDLPPVLRNSLTLRTSTELLHKYQPKVVRHPRLTAAGLSLLGDPPHPVTTWNARNARTEHVLVMSGSPRNSLQTSKPQHLRSMLSWLKEHW